MLLLKLLDKIKLPDGIKQWQRFFPVLDTVMGLFSVVIVNT
jgi:hypothetical protein